MPGYGVDAAAYAPLSQSGLYQSRKEATAALLATVRSGQHFGGGVVYIRVGELTLRGPLPPVELSLQLVLMGRLLRSFKLFVSAAERESAARPGGTARLQVHESVLTTESPESIGSLMAESPLCEVRLLQASGSGGAAETLAIAAVDLAAMAHDLAGASLPMLRPEGAVGSVTLTIGNADPLTVAAAGEGAPPPRSGTSAMSGIGSRPPSAGARPGAALSKTGSSMSSSRPSSARSALGRSSMSARSHASSSASKLGFGVSSSMSAAPSGLSALEEEERRVERDEMLLAQEAWWSAWRVRQLQQCAEWPRWQERMRQGYLVVVAEVRCQSKRPEPKPGDRTGDKKKKSAKQVAIETRGMSAAELRAYELNAAKSKGVYDGQMTTRQDSTKYEQYVKMMCDALEAVLGSRGGEVVVVPDSKESWDERPTGRAWEQMAHRADRKKWQDESKIEHVAADRSFTSARLGAFELQAVFLRAGRVESVLLHSKLASRLWPARAKLERRLAQFLPRKLQLSFVVRATDGSMLPIEVPDESLQLTVAGEALALYGGAVGLPYHCDSGSFAVSGGGANDDWESHRSSLNLEVSGGGGRLEVEIVLQPTRRAFELPIELLGANRGGQRLVARPAGRRTAECTLPLWTELRTDASGRANLRWYGHVERVSVSLDGAVNLGDGGEEGLSAATWPAHSDETPVVDGCARLKTLRITGPAAAAPPPPAPPTPPVGRLGLSFAVRCEDGSLRPLELPDRYISAEVDGARERVLGSSLRVGAASRVRLVVEAGGDVDWEPIHKDVPFPTPQSYQLVLEPSRRRFELPVLVLSITTGAPLSGVRLTGTALGRRTHHCRLPPFLEARTDASGQACLRWQGHVEKMLVSADGATPPSGDRVGETVSAWPATDACRVSDGHAMLARLTLRISPPTRDPPPRQPYSPPATSYSPPPVPRPPVAPRTPPDEEGD